MGPRATGRWTVNCRPSVSSERNVEDLMWENVKTLRIRDNGVEIGVSDAFGNPFHLSFTYFSRHRPAGGGTLAIMTAPSGMHEVGGLLGYILIIC